MLRKIAQEIPTTPRWENIKDVVLFDLMKLKYEQNPELSDKLKETGDLVLYEAVREKKYGCGFSIREKEQINAACPGQNQACKWLMVIRESIKK